MNLGIVKNKTYQDLFIIFLIFIFDRISKIFVINTYSQNSISEIFKSKFLNIHLIWNDGIAFGLLPISEGNLYNFFTSFIVLIIFGIFLMFYKSKGLRRYSYLMIVGGAIGNLFDRIVYKAVPDFIDFHIKDFHWFIFNIADVFITVGIFFMIFIEFTDKNKEQNNYEKT